MREATGHKKKLTTIKLTTLMMIIIYNDGVITI